MFLMSDRWNRNLKTVLLSDYYYQFLYTQQVIFLYTEIWVGCLNIVKASTIFPVFNGMLTAQVFRKQAYNIISSNTFMPGLYIRKRTMILTFRKTWNRSRTGFLVTRLNSCFSEPLLRRCWNSNVTLDLSVPILGGRLSCWWSGTARTYQHHYTHQLSHPILHRTCESHLPFMGDPLQGKNTEVEISYVYLYVYL